MIDCISCRGLLTMLLFLCKCCSRSIPAKYRLSWHWKPWPTQSDTFCPHQACWFQLLARLIFFSVSFPFWWDRFAWPFPWPNRKQDAHRLFPQIWLICYLIQPSLGGWSLRFLVDGRLVRSIQAWWLSWACDKKVLRSPPWSCGCATIEAAFLAMLNFCLGSIPAIWMFFNQKNCWTSGREFDNYR